MCGSPLGPLARPAIGWCVARCVCAPSRSFGPFRAVFEGLRFQVSTCAVQTRVRTIRSCARVGFGEPARLRSFPANRGSSRLVPSADLAFDGVVVPRMPGLSLAGVAKAPRRVCFLEKRDSALIRTITGNSRGSLPVSRWSGYLQQCVACAASVTTCHESTHGSVSTRIVGFGGCENPVKLALR